MLIAFGLLSLISKRRRVTHPVSDEELDTPSDPFTADPEDLLQDLSYLTSENDRLIAENARLRRNTDQAPAQVDRDVVAVYRRVLKLPPGDISPSDLKAAYHTAIMRHHPDRGGDAEDLQLAMDAHECLKRLSKKE